MQELNTALDSTKSNKAQGPDEAPAELFVLLDQDSREQLLHMYNEIWDTSTMPADWGCENCFHFQRQRCRYGREQLSSYFAFEHLIQNTGSSAPKTTRNSI